MSNALTQGRLYESIYSTMVISLAEKTTAHSNKMNGVEFPFLELIG